MRTATAAAALIATAALAGAAHADLWDIAADPDDGTQTDNVLLHGSEQVHDLGVLFPSGLPDEDWYGVWSHAFSSYEAVVSGVTGDLGLTFQDLQRVDETGVQTLNTSGQSALGGVLRLEWTQGPAASPVPSYVRVRGAACGTSCSTWSSYRIRFYDTTYTVPRFNNSGSQATTLLVQNLTDRPCNLTYNFLSADGVLVTAVPAVLGIRALAVVPTATVVPNQSGAVRIAHTCGYGGLAGKAVSLESATGFAFDTPLVGRAR